MSESSTSGVHLELFVRSLCPEGCRSSQTAAIRRLEELEVAGTIDDYTVQICGRAVPPRPSDAVSEFGTYLLNRIAVFQEWAAVDGRSLGTHFEPETVRSTITGEEYDRIVLPVMILAEYEDDALRFVSPSEGSERTWCVPGRLEYLAKEREPRPSTERLAGARGEPPDTRLVHRP
jgi:DNA-binding Lrp family transcriptional regulator